MAAPAPKPLWPPVKMNVDAMRIGTYHSENFDHISKTPPLMREVTIVNNKSNGNKTTNINLSLSNLSLKLLQIGFEKQLRVPKINNNTNKSVPNVFTIIKALFINYFKPIITVFVVLSSNFTDTIYQYPGKSPFVLQLYTYC